VPADAVPDLVLLLPAAEPFERRNHRSPDTSWVLPDFEN
jgi:hypothetical protein